MEIKGVVRIKTFTGRCFQVKLKINKPSKHELLNYYHLKKGHSKNTVQVNYTCPLQQLLSLLLQALH